MNKRILSLIVVLMMVLSLAACTTPAPAASSSAPAASSAAPAVSSEAPAASSAAPAAEKKTYKVAFLNPDMADDSQGFADKMFSKHAAEFNFEYQGVDAKGDPAKQTQDIRNMIAQKIDVIFINPNDPVAVAPALKEAKEAGVLVGIFSSELSAENQQYRNWMVGANDYNGGKAAGEAFIKQFPDGAKIVEIGGQAGHDAQVKRHNGFMDAIKGSKIEIMETQNCATWSTDDAHKIMQDFIVKYGDKIQGIFCHWDYGFTGAIQAMKAANIDFSKIFSIGVDGSAGGWDQVTAGEQNISLAQSFETMVLDSYTVATKALKGEKYEQQNFIPWVEFNAESVKTIAKPEW